MNAVTDLLGGRLNLMFENLPTILPHVRSGKLRLLAVGTKKRSALAPEFPTISDEGVPGYDSATVFGVLAPAKTPAPLVKKMNQDIIAALKLPGMTEALAVQGLEPAGGAPEDFGALIKTEIAKYTQVVKAAKITVD